MSLSKARSINIAILALGGQGGGVLVDWIVGMAEHEGWTAQATSVAGVAQRTGATIYYVELVSQQDRPRLDAQPVLALMAVPGDVDVVIAAELMEAGRAVQRGLVTPDRTTLIASSHRIYSVLEKTTPGNGLADSEPVAQLLKDNARQLVLDDMVKLPKLRFIRSCSAPLAPALWQEMERRAGVPVLEAYAMTEVSIIYIMFLVDINNWIGRPPNVLQSTATTGQTPRHSRHTARHADGPMDGRHGRASTKRCERRDPDCGRECDCRIRTARRRPGPKPRRVHH